ncbi:MAG: LCP family protein [Clostridia bacterium]|nr:LCP family protein [Clostridia bacterium]
MKDDNSYGFSFNDDFDISSSSKQKKQQFEDIVSDTKLKRVPSDSDFVVNIKDYGHYKKKRHGLAGFIDDKAYKIKRWWARLKKGQRRAIITLSSIILVLAILISAFFIVFHYNYNPITDDFEELGIDNVIDKDIINVALFGIDTREKNSFKGLSDSIMILSLNTETKKVKVISIMRDTLVPIESNGTTTYNKITTAYQKGGPELAIKTLNKVFGLDISEYATVNFYGMSDIIETVGGIDAELTDREVKARGNNNHGINDMIQEICHYLGYNPNDYYITTSGKQHLNGVQAVAYARIRYVPNIWGTNNDYGRTDRQRYVMEQLFNKATQMGKTQYVKLAKALIPCSETSLSYSQIISLAFNILLKSPTFEQARIPQNEFLMNSPSGSFGSVVYYDLNYASKVIHAMIYDDMTLEQYVEANGIEKNDWYAKRGSSSGGGTVSRVTPSTSSSTVSQTTETPSESQTSSTESNNTSSIPSSSEETPTVDEKQEEEKPKDEDTEPQQPAEGTDDEVED